MVKIDAVFQGGGIKGIAFVGAINCMEDKGYKWEKLAGTSAGSIIAALLSVGYSGKELKEIMSQCNYKKFYDKGIMQKIPWINNPLSLIKDNGVYSGDPIENWLNGLFQKKNKTKFKHLMSNGVIKLKIIASDITKKKIMILPDDLKNYGIDPMEFNIARAVRMSISIPFFFKPVKLKYKTSTSYVVDGGLLSNFPVWLFDVDKIPRWPTFGFRFINDTISKTAQGKHGLFSFSMDIISTILEKDEEIYLQDKNSVRTVNINTYGIESTDFNISEKLYEKLYFSGYNETEKFLSNWNFNDYISQYRLSHISKK